MKLKWLFFLVTIFLVGVGIGFWGWSRGTFRSLKRSEVVNPEIYKRMREEIVKRVGEEVEVEYEVKEVVRGLYVPWSVVFTSRERMLVTERNGKIREVVGGQLKGEPVYVFDDVSVSDEEGLMGMALHPNYVANKWVYVAYAYVVDSGMAVKVVRLIDGRDRMSFDRVILEDVPAAKFHAGGRLKFGPDGKLYLTTGDATDKSLPQALSSLGGKILRMNDDGSVPVDNPFSGSLVYSYGHRNPQGIDWNDEGEMYSTEHGPSGFDGPGGGDELNMIKKGSNYGWPLVSHEETLAGSEEALEVWTPAVAPGSLLIYEGNVLPQFRENLFFGGLRGVGLYRVVLSDEGEVVMWEKVEKVEVGRVRDVVEGPDGYIYLTSSNRDGRGSLNEGDDKVYVLKPVGE